MRCPYGKEGRQVDVGLRTGARVWLLHAYASDGGLAAAVRCDGYRSTGWRTRVAEKRTPRFEGLRPGFALARVCLSAGEP